MKLFAAASARSVLLSPKQLSDPTMLGQPSGEVLRGINLAFTAITMLPIAYMIFVSFYRVRGDKDPARLAFTYLKVMLPLKFLALLMYTISSALALIDLDSAGDGWYILFRVSYHISLAGGLLSRVVDLLLVMTLVEVGNGFLFCHTESRTLLQRVLRYAAIASCIILAVVAIIAFGIMNAAIAGFETPEWTWYDLMKAAAKLSAFVDIFLFVWAGALMGFSTHVYNKVKHNGALRDSSMLFVYAAILNLVTRLYAFVLVSIFTLAGVILYGSSAIYAAILIAGPILTVWTYAAIAGFLVAIAIRKHDGLWTTVQAGTEEESQPFLATESSSTDVDDQLPGESSSAVPT
ncbi:hypothetical protein KVR01_002902 [Diaporthe batatas]|uniref:uncharacterized protein n=1 Tax=Diaporthe batatas TaxID=748121 RepID=UPI001D03F3C1|nr:uncharacterized protein KVR01_002902 [Diaporthe batatas]KAG8167213.1 hypothetical protein KVR01_002902 [Diaporthe batatas]